MCNLIINFIDSIYGWCMQCRYLVNANGICAGYSLLTAIIAAKPRSPTMSQAWAFFFLDHVINSLNSNFNFFYFYFGHKSLLVLVVCRIFHFCSYGFNSNNLTPVVWYSRNSHIQLCDRITAWLTWGYFGQKFVICPWIARVLKLHGSKLTELKLQD